MRISCLIPLTILTACDAQGTQSAQRSEFQYIAPTSERSHAMIFSRRNGCLAEIDLPGEFDLTGHTVDGKKIDSEQAREFFGLIHFSDWSCPKPITNQISDISK